MRGGVSQPRHAWPDMIVRTLKPKQGPPGPTGPGRRTGPGPFRRRLRAQGGFTIVEALVATLVLAIGLLAGYMMLTISTHSSTDVRAREGAVTLTRQITELEWQEVVAPD